MTSPRIQLDANNAVELTGKMSKSGSWGLIWYHRRPDTGADCDGCLSWDPADQKHWTLISLDPLTLAGYMWLPDALAMSPETSSPNSLARALGVLK